ncbi:aldehyde dehydrogenase family protein [Thalassotalea psychrophila]|uniref:Aldehyde dehydrogenase family protein n=1 Tax=Thalassotalea psychrophila TaxID=3065647 RepID=A0ABY9TTQ0_9GAMM|nr:aldehyde dehydrogenase family protein [Colwelliaceae bacterium SQ149]
MSYQLPIQQLYINDQWCDAAETLPNHLYNASTGEQLCQQMAASDKQVEQALACAQQCFASGNWSELSYQLRADYLDKIAEFMQAKSEQIALADAVQTGVVLALTEQFAKVCSLAFIGAAKLLRELPEQQEFNGANGNIIMERLPLGVAAIIAPWNAPSGIACHKLASALAAGCPVIFKPSEWAAGSAQFISEAIVDAKLPKGTFQMVLGGSHVGGKVVTDKRTQAVSFTGGAMGGAGVGRVCGEQIKSAQLELGGNNALVVLADADLDNAATSIVAGLTTMNAQWCRALGRLVIASSVKNELLNKVKEKFADITLGNALDKKTNMGPLVHQGHLKHVQQRVNEYKELGANIIELADLPDLAGWYHVPTLVDGLKGEQTLEEVFGPVATVHIFDTDDEAIFLANQTDYGLAAYVFGEQDHAWQVAKKLRAGTVKINKVTLFSLRPDLPRSAWGKSGVGDEGTVETFEFFRGTRVIGEA